MAAFIKVSKDRVVNFDQVVDLKYSPASSGTDDETGRPFSWPAELDITLASIKPETFSDFDGPTVAAASKSEVIRLKGLDAEGLWEFIHIFSGLAFIEIPRHLREVSNE